MVLAYMSAYLSVYVCVYVYLYIYMCLHDCLYCHVCPVSSLSFQLQNCVFHR